MQWKSSISALDVPPDPWLMTDYRLQYKNACKLPTILELPMFERLVELHDAKNYQYGQLITLDDHTTNDDSITSDDDYFTGKTV